MTIGGKIGRVAMIGVACLLLKTAILPAQEPPVANDAAGELSSLPSTDTPPTESASTDDADSPTPARGLDSPRSTVATFVQAMETRDFRTATEALDFSSVEPPPDPFRQVDLAQRLKAAMDRLSIIDESQYSEESEGAPVPFPPDLPDSSIVIAPSEDGKWRFSAKTVSEIESIFKLIADKPAIGTEQATPVATEPASPRPEGDAAEVAEPAEAPPPPAPAANVPDEMSSARRTMRSLFVSLDERNYALAVRLLDFSVLETEQTELGPYGKLQFARRLKAVIERIAKIDYAAISDDPEGPTFHFPQEAINQPIQISRDEAGYWRFTADTVARIDALWDIYEDKPVLNLKEEDKRWLDRELVLGNETWRIGALFLSLLAALILGNLLRAGLTWRSNVHDREGHPLRAAVTRTVAASAVGVLFLLGLKVGVSALVLEFEIQQLVDTCIHVIFSLVVGYVAFKLVDVAVHVVDGYAERSGSTLNNMLAPIVRTSMQLTIIVVVLLDIATAISDQPPSAVLAGLGAGGLAVGLAAQETIKNLFGSMMIFADRPFELGDRIVVDGHDGPVESVGFRSTRIRTLDGHLVTVPNGEMANRTIHNVAKRPFIRRVMSVRLAYDTSPAKVREALSLLRDLVDGHEGQKEELPPRVFLEDFLEASINIKVIFWYHPPDYWDYCDFCERFNLMVIDRFAAADIRFALPSRRIFMGEEGEPTLEP